MADPTDGLAALSDVKLEYWYPIGLLMALSFMLGIIVGRYL
jgi:hypothetical protein